MALALHPTTAHSVESFLTKPSHALLLIGPTGVGKGALAQHITSQLLHMPQKKLVNYPYIITIEPIDNKAIGIDQIRELQHFTALKVPNGQDFTRFIIIDNAQTMTHESQNALLKLIEEPPVATMLILTAPAKHTLLPTITSRCQFITVHALPEPGAARYFIDQGHAPDAVQKAYLVSGGLAGLMSALLADDTTHPLVKATTAARQLLQDDVFARLVAADDLSKRPQDAKDVLFVLQQMAHVSLQRPLAASVAHTWRQILISSYTVQEALEQGAQARLALTHLMLTL